MAEIGRDEVVARHRPDLEVGGELFEGTDMADAGGRVRVQPAGDVVEVDERVVFRRVEPLAAQRALAAADSLLVRLPSDPRLTEQRYQVIAVRKMVRSRIVVVPDPVVGAAFEPEVVRLAGM